MRSLPPTVEQLLVLADRAERGPLTAAEASRLRQGIASLDSSRLSMHASLARQAQLRQQEANQGAAFRSIVCRAKARGARTVAVWVLERLLADVETTPEIRQRGGGVSDTNPSAALWRPETTSAPRTLTRPR